MPSLKKNMTKKYLKNLVSQSVLMDDIPYVCGVAAFVFYIFEKNKATPDASENRVSFQISCHS